MNSTEKSKGGKCWFAFLLTLLIIPLLLYSFIPAEHFSHLHSRLTALSYQARNVLQPPTRSSILNATTSISQCVIPDYDPWDKSIKSKIGRVSVPLKCSFKQPDMASLDENGMLVFDQNLLPKNLSTIKCFYMCVTRGNNDFLFNHGPELVVDVRNKTKVDCEFPEVHCNTDTGAEIYTRILCQIVANQTLLSQSQESRSTNQNSRYHHVIMLIFDSVSRLNFLRLCPKSVAVLKEKYKATFMQGHGRTSDSSYKNALAFFAGIDHTNYDKDKMFKDYWDKYPYIWKHFSKAGYLTLDDQDGAEANIFLHLKKGFEFQPMDHRQRVFWLASDKLPGHQHYSEPCYANDSKHKLMFDYLHQFLTKYNQTVPKFVMFWNICLCHDYIERLAYVDQELAAFLENHFHLLKDAFLFVMADHGHKFSSIRNTVVGRYEANMPLMTVSVPESIRKEHPIIMDNLKRNSQLLTSHFDTFVTLWDILQSGTTNNWGDLSSQLSNYTQTGVEISSARSLLRPISTDRSCRSIGIDPEWCVCENIKVIKNDTLGQAIGQAVIEKINSLLPSECAQLNLTKVLVLNSVEKSKTEAYQIAIEAKPSNGTFEAQVVVKRGQLEVEGTVLRTNRYGNQPHCILESKPDLKMYCYCVDR